MTPDPGGLPLRYHTPDEWARGAMADLVALLDDHAHLERKAATNALELLGRWPNPEPPKGWAQTLAAVARDETDHLHKVTRLLAERGAFMSRQHRNPYAYGLRALVRLGEGTLELMDRLIVCSLIELRSCERFEILGRMCTEPKLVKLYTGLWASEHSHYRVFLKLARALHPAAVVEARWEFMLDREAEIIAAQAPGCRMHSGLPPTGGREEGRIGLAELRIYRDTERARRLPVRLYRGVQGAPLILFSPGFGGTCWTYHGLARPWQEAGYHVCLLEHPGSALAQALCLAPRRLLHPAQALRPYAHTPEECHARPLDARYILDRLCGELAPGAVGIAGHSFGSYTALALGGVPAAGRDYVDPRIQAVMALSPHPPGWLFRPEDYARLERPCLMVTGALDRPLEQRLEAYRALRSPAELLVVQGAGHMAFAGWGPRRVVAEAAACGLKFWHRWLG